MCRSGVLWKRGAKNIACAIFGENIRWSVSIKRKRPVENGLEIYDVSARHFGSHQIRAEIPVRFPDKQHGNYRIDDCFFAVTVNEGTSPFTYEAWCEDNSYLGAVVIVRRSGNQMEDRYLVAESMDGEVLYRGSYESLFPWAKKIVQEKLPNRCAS